MDCVRKETRETLGIEPSTFLQRGGSAAKPVHHRVAPTSVNQFMGIFFFKKMVVVVVVGGVERKTLTGFTPAECPPPTPLLPLPH